MLSETFNADKNISLIIVMILKVESRNIRKYFAIIFLPFVGHSKKKRKI